MSAANAHVVAVAVVGVGLVGTSFVSQLLAFPKPSSFRLVALASSKKTLFSPTGLSFSPAGWKADLAQSGHPSDHPGLLNSLAALVRPGHAAVLVDNTSSEDIAASYPAFLRRGIHVVTPNKKACSGSLALYDDILAACAAGPARFLHEATVGAGLPVVSTLTDLVATGDKVTKIEGVLSGTLSYIFNEFSIGRPAGPSFSAVVTDARERGYTEPHPGDDLAGADVARKLTILSRLVPALRAALPAGYASVRTASLVPGALAGVGDAAEFVRRLPAFDAEFAALRADAAAEGMVLRFVGVVDVPRGEIRAALERYPNTHPFATSLGGADNILMFHTERYGARPLIIQGAGAGAAVTAMGVMSDLLKLL